MGWNAEGDDAGGGNWGAEAAEAPGGGGWGAGGDTAVDKWGSQDARSKCSFNISFFLLFKQTLIVYAIPSSSRFLR
jgi:hypothetical protein